MVLNLLKSITIKQRLIGLGFICVLGFVAVFTLLIFTERTLRQASEQVATMVQTSKVVDHIAVLLLSAEIEATRALIIDGSDDAEIVNGLLEDASGDVERLLGLSSASIIQENGKKLGANLAEFKDVFAKGYEVKDKLANGKVSLSERNDLRFQLEQWNKALHDVRLAIDEPLGSLALAIEEAEETVNETAAAQKELAAQVLYAVFAAVVLAVTLSIALIARSILKPIGFLSTTMRRLAADEREIKLPDQDRKDEFGDMNRAVAVFVESAEERRKLERESSEADQQTRERQEKVDQLIQGFRANVNNVLAMVEESMGQVDQTASSLIELSESSSTQTSRANDASQEAATRSEAVAASSDEVSASIQDISLQLKEAHGEIEAAVHTAQTANNEVGSLQGAAREIGQVISLISDIAEQTNLLALNATIEAARAGEAGRGFAVVASEVKSLASQTAKATNEISEKISSIQNATDKAADSIGRIAGTMENVTNHTASISGAVEQQNGAAMEISENVSAAASGTRSVQENISTVREAVEETNKSAEHMRRSSREMLDRTEHLKREVETFLHEVAAA